MSGADELPSGAQHALRSIQVNELIRERDEAKAELAQLRHADAELLARLDELQAKLDKANRMAGYGIERIHVLEQQLDEARRRLVEANQDIYEQASLRLAAERERDELQADSHKLLVGLGRHQRFAFEIDAAMCSGGAFLRNLHIARQRLTAGGGS